MVGPNKGKYLNNINGILSCNDGYEDWVPGESCINTVQSAGTIADC